MVLGSASDLFKATDGINIEWYRSLGPSDYKSAPLVRSHTDCCLMPSRDQTLSGFGFAPSNTNDAWSGIDFVDTDMGGCESNIKERNWLLVVLETSLVE